MHHNLHSWASIFVRQKDLCTVIGSVYGHTSNTPTKIRAWMLMSWRTIATCFSWQYMPLMPIISTFDRKARYGHICNTCRQMQVKNLTMNDCPRVRNWKFHFFLALGYSRLSTLNFLKYLQSRELSHWTAKNSTRIQTTKTLH